MDVTRQRSKRKHLRPEDREAARLAGANNPRGGLTLDGARAIGKTLNPNMPDFLVRSIVGYTVTKIFDTPVAWPTESGICHYRISGGTSKYSATLTGKLTDYLRSESELGQFVKDPGLRENVQNIENNSGVNPTFLVVEECGEIGACRMGQGECWQGPNSGRDGVVIFKTTDGAWPTLSEQIEQDTSLLAAMRAMSRSTHPFELRAKHVLFLTDQDESAHPYVVDVSVAFGGLRVLRPLDPDWPGALGATVKILREASGDPAVKQLLAAIRLDNVRDGDDYLRLWYLSLWQALNDVERHCNNKTVKRWMTDGPERKRWKDLTLHRNAIAHWQTDKVDYERLANLHCYALEVVAFISKI